MANICRGLRKKKNFSPVFKSPTHIGFIDVKKNGSKISHLGTFKKPVKLRKIHGYFCRYLVRNGNIHAGVVGGKADIGLHAAAAGHRLKHANVHL